MPGFDWEDILGSEGGDMYDAYDSLVDRADRYWDTHDEYEDEDEDYEEDEDYDEYDAEYADESEASPEPVNPMPAEQKKEDDGYDWLPF